MIEKDRHSISPPQAGVDQRRRRFAKAGIGASVVLGSLLSRPVLGQAPHNCTISGQISGNVSTHDQGVCSTLGSGPAFYAAQQNPSTWPNAAADFLNNNGNPRLFRNTPFSSTTRFADAYQQRRVGGSPMGQTQDATVREVLDGYVRNGDGTRNTNWVVEAKPNFVSGLTLGQEAIAAYMNAAKSPSSFPLTKAEVVRMFNGVVSSGSSYEVMPGVFWNASDVTRYFASLHP
jgi:hypothetical protein